MSSFAFARGAVLLVALAMPTTGCSVALMRPPPADHQRRSDFYCTPHIGAPIADGVAAAVLLGTATSIGNGDTTGSLTPAQQERGEMPVGQRNPALKAAAAGATAVAVFSSLYGFYQAGKCQRAVYLWRLRTAAQSPPHAPPPPDVWTVPPPGWSPPPAVPPAPAP